MLRFAVIGLLMWSSSARAQCGGIGTPGAFGPSEYLYCATIENWNGADADCATIAPGWALTRVDDRGENAFIEVLGGGNNVWIGGDDLAVEGQWRWPDGDQFWQGNATGTPVGGLYTNWTSGEPGGGTSENCARQTIGGLWGERKCADNYGYVCEGPPICGNGVTGAGEECDDANTTGGDGCSATCTLEGPAPCGDGLIWLGEECDDGDTIGGDGCSSTCEIEVAYRCTGQPSICAPVCSASFEWHSQMGLTTTEYFVCNETLVPSDAETNCEALASGWTLARIDDATENSYLDGIGGVNDLWIGGDDLAVEGEWRWQDGDQFWQGDATGTPVGELYSNWTSGEPGGSTNENCARQENGGLWAERKCTDNLGFLCEGPPICGNGAVAMPENCDDGNTANGDGCSSSCTVESGYECFLPDDAGTPSVCQLSAHVAIGRVELLAVRGEALLQWETTSQSGTLGFVVSRESREGWEPLHEGILLALPGAAQGGVYSLRDPDASIYQAVRYRLEEIEIDGGRKPIGDWELVARPAPAPLLTEGDYDAVPHPLRPRRIDRSTELSQKSDASMPASRVVLEVEQGGAVEVSVGTLAELSQKARARSAIGRCPETYGSPTRPTRHRGGSTKRAIVSSSWGDPRRTSTVQHDPTWCGALRVVRCRWSDVKPRQLRSAWE